MGVSGSGTLKSYGLGVSQGFGNDGGQERKGHRFLLMYIKYRVIISWMEGFVHEGSGGAVVGWDGGGVAVGSSGPHAPRPVDRDAQTSVSSGRATLGMLNQSQARGHGRCCVHPHTCWLDHRRATTACKPRHSGGGGEGNVFCISHQKRRTSHVACVHI